MTPRAFSTVVCHWTLLSFREYMHSLLIAFLVPFLCLALVVIFLVIFHGCLSLHLEFYWVFFYGKLFVNKKMEFFQFYFLKFRRFDDFCGEILEYKPRRGLFYQSRLKTALKSVKFYQFFSCPSLTKDVVEFSHGSGKIHSQFCKSKQEAFLVPKSFPFPVKNIHKGTFWRNWSFLVWIFLLTRLTQPTTVYVCAWGEKRGMTLWRVHTTVWVEIALNFWTFIGFSFTCFSFFFSEKRQEEK